MDLLDNPSPALSCVIVLQTVLQVSFFFLLSVCGNSDPYTEVCRYWNFVNGCSWGHYAQCGGTKRSGGSMVNVCRVYTTDCTVVENGGAWVLHEYCARAVYLCMNTVEGIPMAGGKILYS